MSYDEFYKAVEARHGACSWKRYHCGLCGNQTDTPALAAHEYIPALVARCRSLEAAVGSALKHIDMWKCDGDEDEIRFADTELSAVLSAVPPKEGA